MTTIDLGFGRIQDGYLIVDFTKCVPTFRELAATAHKIAKDKGFWDEQRTIQHCLAMVGTEIVEYHDARAMQGFGEKAPNVSGLRLFKEDIQVVYDFILDTPSGEAADILIRLLDLAGKYELTEGQCYEVFWEDCGGISYNPSVWNASESLFRCIKDSSKSNDNAAFFATSQHLREVVACAKKWCTAARYETELKALIVAKMLYNTTRPYKHGKTA